MKSRLSAVVLASLATASSHARPPAPGHPCSVVDDSTQRLACYDFAFPRPAAAQATRPDDESPIAASQQPSQPASTASASPRSTSSDAAFGQRAERPSRVDRSAEPTEIRAAVTALGRTPSGKHVVTLETGQVWVQTDVESMPALKVGAEVRIEKALLNSFLLITPDKGSMRVRRVQ